MESASRPLNGGRQARFASQSQQPTLLTTKPKRTVDYKIVLLGESSVGKSSILERLQNNSFDDNKSSTIGAAFISKKVIRNEGLDLINLQIWDTAGQERFHNLTPLYYRNSNVAVIIFDLVHKDSFKKAGYWIDELETYIGEEFTSNDENVGMKIILVGNKLDLLNGQQCTFESEVTQFMQQHKRIVKYFQTSAKNNIQIIELFEYIADNIDQSLFHDIDEDNKSKKGLIDLNFTNVSSGNGGQCLC